VAYPSSSTSLGWTTSKAPSLGALPPLAEGKDYAAPGSADYSQELGG